MTYALIHYPNIDTNHINQFRREYDPLVELIEPHITLMFPVPDSIGRDNLVHHLENALAGWQPFPIHLQGFQVSWDDYLFLLLQEGNANIIRLHDEIYTGLLEEHWRKDIPFIPHLTLGVFSKGSTDLERALEEAKQLEVDHHCVLDKLHLVQVNDDKSKIVWSREFSFAK